jgi:hypothetical protein
MRNWLIKLLGGWPKNEALTEAVRQLFNAISEEDILHEEDGVWIVQGKPLNDAQKKLLIVEAKQFTAMRLWKVLQLDLKWKANELMFLKSKTDNDLIVGKLWLYSLKQLKNRLENISKESGR